MEQYSDREYCLEVKGDFACFTRPEFKVERVSYDVITPSAARAIFEAVLFAKYAMRWQVTKIEVLNPVKWISVRRNEVGATASLKSGPIFIEDKRQQRNSLMLRDVAYRIYAKLVFIPIRDRDPNVLKKEPDANGCENPVKYYSEFERRARSGKCFSTPYLGTRECAARWRLVEGPSSEKPPIKESRDLGIMLYDMDFSNEENIIPMFYRANMENGVITVPPLGSKEILK